MKSYLTRVVIVSVIMGVFEIIAPKHQGLEKYTKAIGLLCILCISIAPMKDMIENINDGIFDDIKDGILDATDKENDDYNSILNEYLNEFSSGEFKNEVKSILKKEFDIPEQECEVDITVFSEEGQLKVKSMQILLSGRSIFKNPYTVEEYFNKLLGCECRVLIK